MLLLGMRRGNSFKESIKVLEADIQHANTLALEFPRDFDGACLQMRLSYSPAAHFFLFLVRWTDCRLAGILGLLRILIYKVYKDGTTTMSTYERKSSLREFYAYILPSLQQLQGGITEMEELKQKACFMERYKKRPEDNKEDVPDLDLEWEQECGICMENNTKVVLPDCNHAMCLKCFRDWHARSQSCPFCRDSLKRVNSKDLWIFTESCEVQDSVTLTKDSLKRLFVYIDKLPLLVSESVFAVYDAHLK
ncbi:hypothetical protein GOP47_0009907 [Adiantum capillus-veneris]|uniref:RING-type domain-containing protein n=1 Tax=Adiantum capillus-veneris TaxID=13818 RepID=A0A9D4ZH47_ADICA|nr:hypothetical protein GOP47_0009369 [Adiantum capillus-veneris]KAI5075831.1 hypothetical protein GOP47_0009907 [Adiantum capillus-veneris]